MNNTPVSNPTPSTPEKAYVWDPVAARDRINAAAEAGTITLTPTADGTAYEVSGDTKKVRGYLKGLNARWNPDTTNWLLPALALTDPTAASAERNALIADRQAKRAAKKSNTSKTYTAEEVQQLITKAVCAAFSMMGNMANNEKAIAALTEKLLSA